ncbi:MAG: hypothetical protein AAF630_12620 [Cyanobacteria bacterium P01_C01_bin.38]
MVEFNLLEKQQAMFLLSVMMSDNRNLSVTSLRFEHFFHCQTNIACNLT